MRLPRRSAGAAIPESVRTMMLVWKNLRMVKTGIATQRVSPRDTEMMSDDIDISDTSNSAKRNCRPISGCRRDAHVDAVVAHLHVDRPQAIFGVTAVASGFDVEFPAVPGTDDVALLGETQAAAGLVRRKLL